MGWFDKFAKWYGGDPPQKCPVCKCDIEPYRKIWEGPRCRMCGFEPEPFRQVPNYVIVKNWKNNLLWAVTGGVVVYVRRSLKGGQSLSAADIFAWWLIHFIGVILFSFLGWFVIKKAEAFFFGYDHFEKGLSIEEAMVYIPLIILGTFLCILIFH